MNTITYPHIGIVSVRHDKRFEVTCRLILDATMKGEFISGHGDTLPEAIHNCLLEIRKRADISDREIIRLASMATVDAIVAYSRGLWIGEMSYWPFSLWGNKQ